MGFTRDRIATLILSMGTCLVACTSDNGSTDAANSDTGDSTTSEVDGEQGEGDGSVDVVEVPDGCLNTGTEGATASCLSPTQTPEYYVEQAENYFDTLDLDADPESIPDYSELVARWEWPPWLLLTGYERETMLQVGALLREYDPSRVPERDCRFFDQQPFARCYVVFDYEGRPCPIYEEFVFNDAGEMTFIEAWSDLPGMLPMDRDADQWAEGGDVPRLSTRVPGLGNMDGRIDLESDWMHAAEAADEDVAEFAKRARDQWRYWTREMADAGNDLFERGCGWE